MNWAEITQDNVDELYLNYQRLMIYKDGIYIRAGELIPSLNTIAKRGGYYAYIVPEFNNI